MHNKLLRSILIFTGLFVVFVIIFAYLDSKHILGEGLFYGFKTGDPEVNTYISYVVRKGQGFYSDFSILYGPGRYILVALLFAFANLNYSIVLFHLYFLSIIFVVFPALIGVTSFKILRDHWGNKGIKKKVTNIALALLSSIGYIFVSRNGQDGHIFLLLFILFYLDYLNKPRKWKEFWLGLTLGLLSFFRVELAIIVVISLILSELMPRLPLTFKQLSEYKSIAKIKTEIVKLKQLRIFGYGLGTFLTFYLALLVFKGSLLKFLHDIFILAFIASPKQMGLPILEQHMRFFLIFLVLNLVLVFINILAKNKSYAFLAIVNALLYVSALGRSDYVHLLYSLVIFAPTVLATILSVYQIWTSKTEEKYTRRNFVIFSAKFISFLVVSAGLIFLVLSRESMPLLLVATFFVILMALVLRAHARHALIGIILTSGLFLVLNFNSVYAFAKLQRINLIPLTPQEQVNTLTKFNANYSKVNFAGELIISDTDRKVVDELKQDLKGKTVFIYPTNVSLYYELGIDKPTRYTFLNGEYTDFMEDEVIGDLQAKQIEFVLYFPQYAGSATPRVDDFIKNNYSEVKSLNSSQGEIKILKLN